LSVAASLAVGASGIAGVAASGAGAEATNVILSKANAFADGSALITENDGNVALDASSKGAINATVVGVAASVGVGSTAGVGLAIGASVARNFIGWDLGGNNTRKSRPPPAGVRAYRKTPRGGAAGPVSAPAPGGTTITAGVGAGAVAVGVGGVAGISAAGSGASADNRIETHVQAYIDGDG